VKRARVGKKETADASFSRNQATLAAQHRQLLRSASSATNEASFPSPHQQRRAAGLRAVIKASARRWLPSALRLLPDALPPILYFYTAPFLG
jgi:hypothetical protein